MDRQQFVDQVWRYFGENSRDLPWRQPEADGQFDAYKIMVSEIMLQQTQVVRVIEKYIEFLRVFPTVDSLAAAPLSAVLILWNGLGYNRRAKFLWQAAKELAAMPQPWTYEQLVARPGVGPNTAAAIVVYAYNQPRAFIETNIRTVYIHHFFADTVNISDKDILPLVEQTYDRQNPREFFWALMDYGSYLKTTLGNLSRRSLHYSKQSAFSGSRRQIRGAVLRQLASGPQTMDTLSSSIADQRLEAVITELSNEGFILQSGNRLRLNDA